MEALKVHVEALRAARTVAAGGAAGKRLLVTVQDTGGRLGVAGSGSGRAWLGGLAGLARTAGAEWPAAHVKAIDCEQGGRSPADVAEAIAREVVFGGPALDVGLGADGSRVTVTMAQVPGEFTGQSAAPIGPDSVIVVTGGGRGITAECVIALARQHRPRLALFGRTPLEEEAPDVAAAVDRDSLRTVLIAQVRAHGEGDARTPAQIGREVDRILAVREIRQTLAALTAAGSPARYVAVDVRDFAAVGEALAQVRGMWGEVTGLIHGAGVLADKLIADKSAEQAERVIATKAASLRGLLEHLAGDPLQVLVLFSSVSARVGNAGQSDYAMANEILNQVAALEHQRRPECLVRSIGWGPWRAGMVTASVAAQFEDRGVGLISPRAGSAAFLAELSDPACGPQVLLCAGELPADAPESPVQVQIRLTSSTHPYLADHAIDGLPVVPIALVVEWFHRLLGSRWPDATSWTLRDLQVLNGIRLDDLGAGHLLRLSARAESRTTVSLCVKGHRDFPVAGLRFPPQDLLHAEAQQSLLLEATAEALEGVQLPGARTIVLAGMGCSPDVARFAAGPRVAVGAAEAGADEPGLLRRIREAFAPPLNAAAAVGTMPNMVANRINAQFDITGPGYTVSAEEASGLVALDLAAAVLRSGEADAAIVGAVDLSCEIVHTAARQELGLNGECGDAAVVLVLKRRSVAQRCGDTLIALLDEQGDQAAGIRVGLPGGETPDLDPRSFFGSAHAADGLLAVATAIQCLRYQMLPRPNAVALPWLDAAVAEVAVQPLQAPQVKLRLRRSAATGLTAHPPPEFHIYSGQDRSAVIAALDAEREAHQGPARLVIVSSTAAGLARLRQSARDWLEGRGPQPAGAAFRTRPLDGDIAFVYASGAAAYPRMGRDLIRAFPTLADHVDRRVGPLSQSLGWAYRTSRAAPDVRDRMSGATALAALHTEVASAVLGLQAQAALGHSSGEYAALAALSAWRNAAAVFDTVRKSDLFTRQVSGDYAAVHTAWHQDGITGGTWANYLVAAGAPEVEAALAAEPAVHLMAINAPGSCSICGDEDGCMRVIQRLGNPDAIALSYDLAIHAPELKTVSEQWRHLYRQPTWPVPETRFYSCATCSTYPITPDAVADALTKQALTTVDFAGTVEQAWADGVRIFIEHGPQPACTTWIDQILADRDHVAVALDAPRRDGIRQLAYATAELLAAGVAADHRKLTKHLFDCRPPAFTPGQTFTLPAHRPPVRLPALDPEPQELPQPPELPPSYPRHQPSHTPPRHKDAQHQRRGPPRRPSTSGHGQPPEHTRPS
jgi:NAD(P)-dependent dehydrogenase (short-subunit alcohol dehydrogenase family)/malonyl CoA-acyl carrier protein transacylase